jgi:hypothetical protein
MYKWTKTHQAQASAFKKTQYCNARIFVMWHDSRHQKKDLISPSANGKHVLCIQENNTQGITWDMYEPSMILKDHKLLLYHSFVTTVSQLKMCDLSGGSWSATIFYECNNDTTAPQWQVLQTALRHDTCYKCTCKRFFLYQ